VYEEHLVSHKTCRAKGYPNQMEFGAFLDFMLAWDNRSSLAGIQYLFPVLDLKGRGYLSQVWVTLAKTLSHDSSGLRKAELGSRSSTSWVCVQCLFPGLDLKGRGHLSQVPVTMQQDWLRTCCLKSQTGAAHPGIVYKICSPCLT